MAFQKMKKAVRVVTATNALNDGSWRAGDEKLHPDYLNAEQEPPDDPLPPSNQYSSSNTGQSGGYQQPPYQGQQSYNSSYADPRTPGPGQYPPQHGYSNQQQWPPPNPSHYPNPHPHYQGAYANTTPFPGSPSYTHKPQNNNNPQYSPPPQQQQFSPPLQQQQFPPDPRPSIDSYNSNQSYSTAPHNNQQYFPPAQSPPQPTYQASPPPHQAQWSPTPAPHAQLPAPERALSYDQYSAYGATNQPSETTTRQLIRSPYCLRDGAFLNSDGSCPTCGR